jgi:hypothetical protein
MKLKPDINSVEVHPRVSYYRHPMDGALVGGSLWWIVNKKWLLPLHTAKFKLQLRNGLILFPNLGAKNTQLTFSVG